MNRSSFCSVAAFILAGFFPLILGTTRVAQPGQQPGSRGQAVTAGAELSPEEILEQYTKALGSREAIEKIKSRSAKGTAEYTGSVERASVSLEYYWKAPGKTFAVQRASFGDIKRGFNGSQGWASHPHHHNQVRILDDEQINELRQEMAIYYRPQALKTL